MCVIVLIRLKNTLAKSACVCVFLENVKFKFTPSTGRLHRGFANSLGRSCNIVFFLVILLFFVAQNCQATQTSHSKTHRHKHNTVQNKHLINTPPLPGCCGVKHKNCWRQCQLVCVCVCYLACGCGWGERAETCTHPSTLKGWMIFARTNGFWHYAAFAHTHTHSHSLSCFLWSHPSRARKDKRKVSSAVRPRHETHETSPKTSRLL